MATGTSDLDGLFKNVYAPDIAKLMPEASKLVRAIPFKTEDKIGKQYCQPVSLTFEHGVTYAAPAAGAFTLKSAVSMKMAEAQVDGYQHVLRAQMDYETASKASAGGEKAFRKATELQVENMMESITKRLELDLLYGQIGVGAVAIGGTANIDTTHTLVTVRTADWATGIWAGMENAKINFYNATSLISSSTDAIFTVDSVDVENRQLTVSGTTTGIAALDTAAASYVLTIYFDGAYGNSMAGIQKIIENTGTLFNISAATYAAWKGNQYSANSAALSFVKILSGLAKPAGRGLDEKVTLFLNDRTWANIASDQAAMRKYDASYSEEKMKNGTRAITFYSQNGEVEIQPYNCIKEGLAFGLPLKRLKRIGATDITWTLPGSDPENPRFFRELADGAGFEYRVYSDQAIFSPTPAKLLEINNIVNS